MDSSDGGGLDKELEPDTNKFTACLSVVAVIFIELLLCTISIECSINRLVSIEFPKKPEVLSVESPIKK